MKPADELLMLAAKAAGIFEEWPAPDYGVQESDFGLWCSGMGKKLLWNPRGDDGDSRRLEVALNIEVRFHLAGAVPAVTATCAADSRIPVMREPWDDDKPAATRLAVLRVAAAIGKAMP